MDDILKRLKEQLNSMTQEELDEEWEKLKHWNEFGPTIEEYIEGLKMWGLIKNENSIS